MGAHGLHSPFVFALNNKVVRKASHALPSKIEQLKSHLLRNDNVIDVIDFKSGKTKRSTIGGVARSSFSTPKFMDFLRLLTEHLGAAVVLETGTSLGLNALNLAESDLTKKVVSIEGSEIIYRLAERNCAANQKIELIHGDLYEQFASALVRYQPDMVFLDADHRSSAIQFCLEQIEIHCPNVKCIVIHDIYWSKDMAEGWNAVVENRAYPLTIDLFQAGLIFPSHPIVKQHFTLRF
jgi:predicted O-methyltransferase YrrM